MEGKLAGMQHFGSVTQGYRCRSDSSINYFYETRTSNSPEVCSKATPEAQQVSSLSNEKSAALLDIHNTSTFPSY